MAILKLTDICKDYQQGKEPVRVLKNINMTVEQGEYLAIMGPSGSGKTTLMNLIGREVALLVFFWSELRDLCRAVVYSRCCRGGACSSRIFGSE